MRIDLQDIQLIDTHCHKYIRRREHPDFAGCVSMTGDPHPIEDDRSMLLYSLLMRRLRRHYALPETADEAEVTALRYKLYDQNPSEYAASLRKASKIKYHCYDIGSPVSGDMNTPADNAWFDQVAEQDSVKIIARIEPIMRELFQRQLPFQEYLDAFDKRVRDEIETHHAIALKSVIGYHTGLNVHLVSEAQARTGYEKFLSGKGGEEAEKDLRDYMIPLSLEICKDLDIPMQIHTGLGSAPYCDLRKMKPSGLYDVITDPRFKGKVKIVLLHAGYPWVEETGLLVNHFSHVYSDFSAMIYSASTSAYRKILQMFETAPTNKIMYASDAGGYPETLWYAAVYFKEQLAKALEFFVEEDIIGYDRAMEIAGNVCHNTAQKVYSRLQD